MKYKAVLLDIDGTLINLDAVVNSMIKASKEMKLKPLTKYIVLNKIIGHRTVPTFKKIYPKYASRAYEFRRLYHKAYFKAKETPTPYSQQVLKLIKRNGLKIGIVTSKSKVLAKKTLRRFVYDALITEDDVVYTKPNKEPVVKVCRKLRVKPRECVFVGDMNFDMMASRRAGCALAIGILTGKGSRKELSRGGADKIIKNLKGLEKLLNLR
jgi:pyrophosphatase PpaX